MMRHSCGHLPHLIGHSVLWRSLQWRSPVNYFFERCRAIKKPPSLVMLGVASRFDFHPTMILIYSAETDSPSNNMIDLFDSSIPISGVPAFIVAIRHNCFNSRSWPTANKENLREMLLAKF